MDAVICWKLPRLLLESRWRHPLQLISVRLRLATAADTALPLPDAGSPEHTLLAWLSCEKASSELALDDPLQEELAMAIMALKAESLHKAGFQDERPAGGDNVTPLPGPAYNMK